MAAARRGAGLAQIGIVLAHTEAEAAKHPVRALVLVEDTMEGHEYAMVARASRLEVLGVPVFGFHEVGNERAESALCRIAETSGGACIRFAEGAYATGGKAALLRYGQQIGTAAVMGFAAQLKIEGSKG